MNVPFILNIQRFCLDDGDGIRTTVFLKGCPLKCWWCHNPESQYAGKELWYNENNCTGCQTCMMVCKHNVHYFENGTHKLNRSNCIQCGACGETCLKKAVGIYGKTMSIQEIMEVVLLDRIFYGEDGGMTLSGGEVLMFPEFVYKLAKAAKENGIHVTLETSGYGSCESIRLLIPVVDEWLYDYKAGTAKKHKILCGVSNEIIQDNLKILLDSKVNIRIRYPIIQGENDTIEDKDILQNLLRQYKENIPIEYLPYHNLGESKAKAIGR